MRNRGEVRAKEYLEKQMGWEFLQANYLKAGGEIDLIFLESFEGISHLHFVEVKSWKNTEGDFHPAYSITQSKRERYRQTALHFVMENKQYEETYYQFDLLLVNPFAKKIELLSGFFN